MTSSRPGDSKDELKPASSYSVSADSSEDPISAYCLSMVYDNKDRFTLDEEKSSTVLDRYSERAEAGDLEAQFYMIMIHTQGRVIPKNEKFKDGAYWFKKAEEQINALRDFETPHHYREAITQQEKILLNLEHRVAAAGNAETQYKLAVKYKFGDWPVVQDARLFMYWCTQAAENNHEKAQVLLASCYHLGKAGMTQDHKTALKWYFKAAEQEVPEAQFLLAINYELGNCGVSQDDALALIWYTKAAKNGHTQAQFALAQKYKLGECGLVPNEETANEWLTLAALNQHPEAEFELGYKWWLLSQDADPQAKFQLLMKAFIWFEKAAKQNHSQAQFSLAGMYLDGEGVLKDFKKAFEWYDRAAKLQNPEAFYNLGLMYERGLHVVQNYRIAAEWYYKALNFSDVEETQRIAKHSLANCFREAQFVELPSEDQSRIIFLAGMVLNGPLPATNKFTYEINEAFNAIAVDNFKELKDSKTETKVVISEAFLNYLEEEPLIVRSNIVDMLHPESRAAIRNRCEVFAIQKQIEALGDNVREQKIQAGSISCRPLAALIGEYATILPVQKMRLCFLNYCDRLSEKLYAMETDKLSEKKLARHVLEKISALYQSEDMCTSDESLFTRMLQYLVDQIQESIQIADASYKQATIHSPISKLNQTCQAALESLTLEERGLVEAMQKSWENDVFKPIIMRAVS